MILFEVFNVESEFIREILGFAMVESAERMVLGRSPHLVRLVGWITDNIHTLLLAS